VPYDDIVRTVYRGFARPWRMHIPDWYEGATDRAWHYETDPDKARPLLASLAGKNLTFNYAEGTAAGEQIAVLVQQALDAAGVKVKLEKLTRADYDAKKIKGELPFFLDEFDSPVFIDPVYGFQEFFTSNATQIYLTRYKNAKRIDLIVARLAREKNAARRRALVARGLEILAEDMPLVPIAMAPTTLAASRDVVGIVPHGGESLPYYPAFRFR
jgi:ABC-type transport system substrate-binding protein